MSDGWCKVIYKCYECNTCLCYKIQENAIPKNRRYSMRSGALPISGIPHSNNNTSMESIIYVKSIINDACQPQWPMLLDLHFLTWVSCLSPSDSILYHDIVKWYNDYRFSPTMPSQKVLSAAKYYKRKMTGRHIPFQTQSIDKHNFFKLPVVFFGHCRVLRHSMLLMHSATTVIETWISGILTWISGIKRWAESAILWSGFK